MQISIPVKRFFLQLSNYWKSSAQARVLLIACSIFALLDIVTTVACVEISNYPDGEANPLFRWVFNAIGVWWAIIPMLLVKFLILVFVCFGSMQAMYQKREAFIIIFPLIYLIAHAVTTGNNIAGLQMLLR